MEKEFGSGILDKHLGFATLSGTTLKTRHYRRVPTGAADPDPGSGINIPDPQQLVPVPTPS